MSLLVAVACAFAAGCRQEIEHVQATREKAEQGDAEAQFMMVVNYSLGEGVPQQDYVEAAKWWRKAAEQGHVTAQYQLGWMYFRGQGVPQDEVEGYAWCLLAKAKGHEEASKEISFREKRLTAEQIEKGKAPAAELHCLIEQKKKSAE